MSARSVFDVPRNPSQLKSAKQGFANAHYRQISATKDVTRHQFSQGVQQFRFDTSGNTWFMPSMCYFRLRCSLSQVREDGGAPLPVLTNGDLAPNMGLAANLFKSIEVQLNGHTIERLSERVAQIDALKTRLGHTKGWLQNIGKYTNFWDVEFPARQDQVSVDGFTPHTSKSRTPHTPTLEPVMVGFQQGDRFLYQANRGVGTCEAQNDAHPINLQHGPMALRRGDAIVAGGQLHRIKHVIDATHVSCAVEGNTEAGIQNVHDGDHGVQEWHIQKIQHAIHNTALGMNQFEIVWRPPLGFLDVEHAIPPGGQWLIEFNPTNLTDCQQSAIESFQQHLQPLTLPTQRGQFQFQVDEFQLYLYEMEAERFDRGTWYLDVQNTRCQMQSMPPDCTSLVQKNFDVHAKTTQLTLAFQDQAEGSDTRYSKSKFKIRSHPAEEKEGCTDQGQDLMLERFYISYGHEQKPTPDFDGRFDTPIGSSHRVKTNYLVHRYVDSLMHAGLYHSEGGAESFDEWLHRGPYYHFRWPKDATEQSTRASVNFKFSRPFHDQQQHQIMLFSQWRSAFKITHRDGRVEIHALQEL